MTRHPLQAMAMQIHGTIHFLAKRKRIGDSIPISITALIKWHKESVSELMRHGLAHRSPLERHHIEGPVGNKF